MGKKSKDHKKRLEKRNQTIASNKKKFNNAYMEAMTKFIEEKKLEGVLPNDTSIESIDDRNSNDEIIDDNVNGPLI